MCTNIAHHIVITNLPFGIVAGRRSDLLFKILACISISWNLVFGVYVMLLWSRVHSLYLSVLVTWGLLGQGIARFYNQFPLFSCSSLSRLPLLSSWPWTTGLTSSHTPSAIPEREACLPDLHGLNTGFHYICNPYIKVQVRTRPHISNVQIRDSGIFWGCWTSCWVPAVYIPVRSLSRQKYVICVGPGAKYI